VRLLPDMRVMEAAAADIPEGKSLCHVHVLLLHSQSLPSTAPDATKPAPPAQLAQPGQAAPHLLQATCAPLLQHVFPQCSSARHSDRQRAAGGQLTARDACCPDGLEGEASGGGAIAQHAARPLAAGVVEQRKGVTADAWCAGCEGVVSSSR
jgi:hypothetical protein